MKKIFTVVFSILLVFSVTVSAAAISPKATNRVNTTIPPDSIVRVGTPLSMAYGETVTISCSCSPRMADVDFGILTPRNTFIFVEAKNGACNQTIQISETGTYYFAVRNNTNGPVEVLGYVYY